MKSISALMTLLILFSFQAAAQDDGSGEVEAITIISLPVDSVTIYPDGLATVKRIGSMEITEGLHKLVLDLPRSVSMDSVRFEATNATVEKIVYDDAPIYFLNVSNPGLQDFELGYLMRNAGYWGPSYSLYIGEETLTVSAYAIVENNFGEDLEDVKLKLVAGPPQPEPLVALREALFDLDYAMEEDEVFEEAPMMAFAPEPAAPKSATGDLETLYIYELEGRKDLEMDKEVGLPFFEETAPVDRVYTWNAYFWREGPVVETVKANNTMNDPWPAGEALLYKNDEYVTRVNIPYTTPGTEATIEVGSSADLTVSRKLANYTIKEEIEEIEAAGNKTHVVEVTTETWTYRLELESNVDRNATVEVEDTRPLKATLVSVEPEPTETTATGLEWKLDLEPREETTIEYTYRIVTTESLSDSK